ncbi:hypothetical protein AGMMS49992_30610 [Clostridia bacterium]|nr:hypothetical protein AGMMS49992_30610 [Clostridia bacterium]
MDMTLTYPADEFTPLKFETLKQLVYSRYNLLKRAFGLDELPIIKEDGLLKFPWFPDSSIPNDILAYIDFINRLCRHALTTRFVTQLECKLYNEKYQGTTFLISLGMGWKNRHVILKGLSGTYAYASMRKARDAGWVPYYAQYRDRRKMQS